MTSAAAPRSNVRWAAATAATCVVVAIAAGLAVDPRLDRHWPLRGVALLLAVLCAGILIADRGRKVRRAIGFGGLLLWGVIMPVTTTTWSTPPEIDFALAVADDAEAAATRNARSIVTPEDVRAAAEAKGGAVGTKPSDRDPQVQGATEFPLVLRPQPDQARPRACLSFKNGMDAEIRPC